MDNQTEITFLREQLGAKLVAYIGSATSTKTVSNWIAGQETPSADVAARLSEAYSLALRLSALYSPVTIRAWMTGSEDPSVIPAPARVLREGSKVERDELSFRPY